MLPLGLLPLIKGTFIVTTGIFGAVLFLLFCHQRQRALAYGILIFPAMSTVVFWLFAGQPLSALPEFLTNIGRMMSAYSEAMAVYRANGSEIAAWIIVAGFILYSMTAKKKELTIPRLALIACLGFFLFVSFKEGFVRHTGAIAGTSALIAGLLLTVVFKSRSAVAGFAMALVWWGGVGNRYLTLPSGRIYYSIRSIYSAITFDGALEGLRQHWSGEEKARFDASLAEIRKKVPIPRVTGTTDIYSIHQTELLASGNSWSPRPSVQSYAAFGPRLAEANKAHLESMMAPRNILFQIDLIDNRLPSLEDGLSWPTIIRNYSVMDVHDGFAYLKRLETGGEDTPMRNLGRAGHYLNEEVPLPPSKGAQFVEIDLRPTLLGRVASLLFKTGELHMFVRHADGVSKFRFIASMGRTKFLLSPLVESTSDFVALAALGKSDGPFKFVKSFRISSGGGKSPFWNTNYSMTLSTTALGGNANLDKFSLLDPLLTEKPKAETEGETPQCDFGLDWLNGASPATPPEKISSRLAVKGWTVISAKEGIAPEKTLFNAYESKAATLH